MRNFISKARRRVAPWALAVGGLAAKSASAQIYREESVAYRELVDAKLETQGQQGVQIVRLANGETIRVELQDLEFRDGQIFLREEALATQPAFVGNLGDRLELIPQDVTIIQDNAPIGGIATSIGTAVGAIAMMSTLSEVSDDYAALSAQALAQAEAEDEPLDAEEDALAEDAEDEDEGSEPLVNLAPIFGDPPTGGTVIESAVDGTLIGASVTATDPEGGTLIYTLTSQDVAGAFTVDAATGDIKVGDGSLLDFETKTEHSLEITVTDDVGNTDSQTVSIAITDAIADTIDREPTLERAREEFESGAFGFGSVTIGGYYYPELFMVAGVDASDTLHFEAWLLTNTYFYPLIEPPRIDASLPSFGLDEVDAITMTNGSLILANYLDGPTNAVMLDAENGPLDEILAPFASSTIPHQIDEDRDGVAEYSFSLSGSTVTQVGPSNFSTTDPAFLVEAGMIFDFWDLTDDGLPDMVIKHSGDANVYVYENQGTSFSTSPLDKTIFTGIDVDALAGGRALDISVGDHWGNFGLSVLVLGETDTFLFDLT